MPRAPSQASLVRRASSSLLFALAGLMFIGVIAAGFLAYFITRVDPATGAVSDGLGRSLQTAPIIARLFGAERLWPGLAWFLGDIVWFFGGLGAAYGLMQAAGSLSPTQTDSSTSLGEEEKRAFDPFS